MVGQRGAGLAAVHFAEVQRCVVVEEVVAVDQRHGPRTFDQAQRMQGVVLHEQLRHFIVGGGRGHGRGLHHLEATQNAGPDGLLQLRQYGHAAVLQHFQGARFQFGARLQGGAPEQPALAIGDVQIAQRTQVFGRLYAFGHQLGSKDLCNPLDGAQHLQAFGVFGEVGDEVLVDLHVLGLDLGPQAQAGAPVAKVVQCQAHARSVQMLYRLAQGGSCR
jgi:hypothetical protein